MPSPFTCFPAVFSSQPSSLTGFSNHATRWFSHLHKGVCGFALPPRCQMGRIGSPSHCVYYH